MDIKSILHEKPYPTKENTDEYLTIDEQMALDPKHPYLMASEAEVLALCPGSYRPSNDLRLHA